MAKDLTQALHELTQQSTGQTTRVDKSLPAGKTAQAIPARVGASLPVAQKAAGSSGGGSIASPLTEGSYAARTFWPAKTITSTDGLFSLQIKCLKQITMADANTATVIFNFADKP